MFDDLKTEGLEETQDRLGGFSVKESDAYTGTIMAAYGGKSAAGAKNVTIHVDLKGTEYRQTIYVTNKKGENFFLNANDKSKKVPLPGFTVIDDICVVTTGKPLSQQVLEDKVMNVYDKDEKKELPKTVPMLVDLIGKEVTLGIIKKLVNKNEESSPGVYTATAETREENDINKVFHYPSNVTVPEARAAQEAGREPVADFYTKWVEKNKGIVKDDREIKDGQGAKSGKPGSAPQAGTQQKPTSSLFGGKS